MQTRARTGGPGGGAHAHHQLDEGRHGRLVVHGFKPHLRSAPKKLGSVRIPEGAAIPPNTMAELERDMVRLAVLRGQIAAIEQTRLERIEAAPDNGPHAMIPSSPASLASASRRRTCW